MPAIICFELVRLDIAAATILSFTYFFFSYYVFEFFQVCGKLSSLEEHIDAAKSKPLFKGTDFKLATSHHPANDQVAKECGFTSLSIRVVDVSNLLLYSILELCDCLIGFLVTYLCSV